MVVLYAQCASIQNAIMMMMSKTIEDEKKNPPHRITPWKKSHYAHTHTPSHLYIGQFSLQFWTVSHLVTELFTVAYFCSFFFTLIRQCVAKYICSVCAVCVCVCFFYSFCFFVLHSVDVQQLQNSFLLLQIYVTLPINRESFVCLFCFVFPNKKIIREDG